MDFRREVWICSLIHHEKLVNFKGFVIGFVEEEEGTTLKLSMVMEYCAYGNLYTYLQNQKEKITWECRIKIAQDIATGMWYLHSNVPPILHHDLKSVNVLIHNKSEGCNTMAKLTDFGEARTFYSYTKRDNVENPIWLAPEVLQGESFTTKSDVYSYAIILWELVSREHPFDEFEQAHTGFSSDLEDAIVNADLRPSISNKIDNSLLSSDTTNKCLQLYSDIVEECWKTSPLSRPLFHNITNRIRKVKKQLETNEKLFVILWNSGLDKGDVFQHSSTISE